MVVAKAKGRLRGRQAKLSPRQEAHLVSLWHAGGHTTLELAELSNVARSTIYRAIQRAGPPTTPAGSHPRRAEHPRQADAVTPVRNSCPLLPVSDVRWAASLRLV